MAVTLAVSAILVLCFSNEKEKFATSLGCKRSWVQIPPRRPSYLTVIIEFTLSKAHQIALIIYAYTCSRMQAKEPIGGGNFGGKPDHKNKIKYLILFRQFLNSNTFKFKSLKYFAISGGKSALVQTLH